MYPQKKLDRVFSMKGIGGGIITRKLLFAVLLISSLSLTGIAGASAADVCTAQKQVNNSTVMQNKSITPLKNITTDTQKSSELTDVKSTSSDKTQQTSYTKPINTIQSTVTTPKYENSGTNYVTTQNTVNSIPDNNSSQQTVTSQDQLDAAAGTTTSTSTNTVSEVTSTASSSKNTFETLKKFPATVKVGSNTMDAAPFIAMEAQALLQLNAGTNNPIPVTTWTWATNPLLTGVSSGTIQKAEYIDIANKVYTFYKTNGHAPNYVNTSLGQMNLVNLYYALDRILAFYQTNKYLPSYVTIKNPPYVVAAAASGNYVPPASDPYLQPTANCQVNDPAIKALANSIASKYSTTYDKATAIFNWVRDNIGYSFYYNTKYGAVGTLNSRTANCVDTAHLVVALERAAGIPARYSHVYAQFSSGNWYGHVVATVWINGIWYYADATSSYNTFGAIRNWNTNTATYYGVYQSLPF